MVKIIKDCPSENKTKREITFSYDSKNKKDISIIEKIEKICREEQDRCNNCINFYHEGCLGGYIANACKIYGILESWDNPHYDMDGSKCKDYKRTI